MAITPHILVFILGASVALALFLIYSLLREKQQLSLLIDLTIEGMILSNKQGRILQCNQQALKIFGFEQESDVVGKTIMDFIAPESLTLVQSKLLHDTMMYECVLLRRNGVSFSALVRGSMVGLNKSLRLSAVIDVSELKEAQYALQALNENLELQVQNQIHTNRQQEAMLFHQSRHAQMGEMISMIAHQWRQPLNVLSLLAQNIAFKYKQQKLDDKIMEEFKSDSMRQILQMSKTIDDFRDFFKPDKSMKVFDIKQQLEYAIEMVRPLYATHGIEFACSLEDGLKIESFPNEFGQSLINILNNAKDVLIERNITKAKQIRIEAKRDAEMICVSIEDNGGGIDDALMPQIFQPYFSTKGAKHGTGLGLYMTKMIIEDHMHGTIHVENTSEGARFEIRLRGLA